MSQVSQDLKNAVLKVEELQRRSQYVNLNGSARQVNIGDVKEKLYKKATKIYDRLINSEMSVFSQKNNLIDLLVRDESEFALLQNFRAENYEKKLSTAKSLYRKIIKK